jgi:hypothetical protein
MSLGKRKISILLSKSASAAADPAPILTRKRTKSQTASSNDGTELSTTKRSASKIKLVDSAIKLVDSAIKPVDSAIKPVDSAPASPPTPILASSSDDTDSSSTETKLDYTLFTRRIPSLLASREKQPSLTAPAAPSSSAASSSSSASLSVSCSAPDSTDKPLAAAIPATGAKKKKKRGPVKPKATDIFKAREIRGRYCRSGKWWNVVCWDGYDDEATHNTIEPNSNILDKQLIQLYNDVKEWQWEYVGDDGDWHAMSSATSSTIDGAYQVWLNSTDPKHSDECFYYTNFKDGSSKSFSYYIEFGRACPQQVNVDTHKTRACRRIPVS